VIDENKDPYDQYDNLTLPFENNLKIDHMGYLFIVIVKIFPLQSIYGKDSP
jgi:hypothetical protein